MGQPSVGKTSEELHRVRRLGKEEFDELLLDRKKGTACRKSVFRASQPQSRRRAEMDHVYLFSHSDWKCTISF